MKNDKNDPTRPATVPQGVSVDVEYRLDVALEAYADIFDGMPGSHAKAMRHAIDAAMTPPPAELGKGSTS